MKFNRLNFRSTILLFLVFLLPFDGDKIFSGDIYLVETIEFDLREIYLNNPKKVVKNEELIFWIEDEAVKVFSSRGSYKYTIKKLGNGPGEYNIIDDAYLREKNLFIFNNSSKKVINYEVNSNGFTHVRDIQINAPNSRNFIRDKSGNLYFLQSHNFNPEQPAVSKFDSVGNELDELGQVPITAALSRSLRGDGLAMDNRSNIYYSYLGDPRLFLVEANTTDVLTLTDVPDYFSEADSEKVENIKEEIQELIPYAYSISRIIQVLEHQNYIIQVVEDGGPGMDKDLQYYLEIWSGKKKVASEISISGKFIFSDGEFIYCLAGEESKLISKEGMIELINKYELNI